MSAQSVLPREVDRLNDDVSPIISMQASSCFRANNCTDSIAVQNPRCELTGEKKEGSIRQNYSLIGFQFIVSIQLGTGKQTRCR